MSSGGPEERDYYQILGVSPTAGLGEITAAYHRLACKLHPDAGATDPQSLARFKLVNEAYEVLSDEQGRRAYDRRRRSHPVRVCCGSAACSSGTRFPAGSRQSSQPYRLGSQDIEVELPIAPEEAFQGGWSQFTLRMRYVCARCGGCGRFAGSCCETCQGRGMSHEERRLQIALPRGVRTGTVIRVAGQGKRSATSAGDLLLRIRIQPCW